MIVVGGVIKKDNKYLLIQEGQECCKGKWNLPAGILEINENVFDGAKREIYEECGYEVEIDGIATIGNRIIYDDNFLVISFSTKIIGGNLKYDNEEIIDARWFSYDEVIGMQSQLRSYDWIINAITAVENNNVVDKNLIKIIK